ncbi:hypothetical protein C0J26_01355 [Pseudomonas baetica]|nr:hypothetical protein C0J26_01355 [Pseudomonas baetica]
MSGELMLTDTPSSRASPLPQGSHNLRVHQPDSGNEVGVSTGASRPEKPGENASFNFTLVDRPAHPHIGATDA